MSTVKTPTRRAVAEALQVAARPPRTLPASWWDQGVQERMGVWLKLHQPNVADRFASAPR